MLQLKCGTSGNAVPTLLMKCGTSGSAVPTLLTGCTAPPAVSICVSITGDIKVTWSGLVACSCADMYAATGETNANPFFISTWFSGGASGTDILPKYGWFDTCGWFAESAGPVAEGFGLDSGYSPKTCSHLNWSASYMRRQITISQYQILIYADNPTVPSYMLFYHLSATPLVAGVAYANQLTVCGQDVGYPLGPSPHFYGCCTGGTVTLENP